MTICGLAFQEKQCSSLKALSAGVSATQKHRGSPDPPQVSSPIATATLEHLNFGGYFLLCIVHKNG
jgi:hypothetical protein